MFFVITKKHKDIERRREERENSCALIGKKNGSDAAF